MVVYIGRWRIAARLPDVQYGRPIVAVGTVSLKRLVFEDSVQPSGPLLGITFPYLPLSTFSRGALVRELVRWHELQTRVFRTYHDDERG